MLWAVPGWGAYKSVGCGEGLETRELRSVGADEYTADDAVIGVG